MKVFVLSKLVSFEDHLKQALRDGLEPRFVQSPRILLEHVSRSPLTTLPFMGPSTLKFDFSVPIPRPMSRARASTSPVSNRNAPTSARTSSRSRFELA